MRCSRGAVLPKRGRTSARNTSSSKTVAELVPRAVTEVTLEAHLTHIQVFAKILPTAAKFGICLVGKSGRGKTPIAKIWSMALCRYWINARSLHGKRPRIRTGANCERFAHRPQTTGEAWVLDDPDCFVKSSLGQTPTSKTLAELVPATLPRVKPWPN